MNGKKIGNLRNTSKKPQNEDSRYQIAQALGLCPVAALGNSGKLMNTLPDAPQTADVGHLKENADKAKFNEVMVKKFEKRKQDQCHEEDQHNKMLAAASRKRRSELIFKPKPVNVVPKVPIAIEDNRNAFNARRLDHFISSYKGYNWLIDEWFLANVDDAVSLQRKTEFQRVLESRLSHMKTRHLNRLQWSYIRELIGKPRRLSAKFLCMQRHENFRRREIVRIFQRGETVVSKEDEYLADIPDEVPVILSNGTGVATILRSPFQGIHFGIVQEYNPKMSLYNVRICTPGMGIEKVCDFEIVSLDFQEVFSVVGPIKVVSCNAVEYSKFKLGEGDYLNGYAVRKLKALMNLKHILKVHAAKVRHLAALNNEAEQRLMRSAGDNEDKDDSSSDGREEQDFDGPKLRHLNKFQRQYADQLWSIYKLNNNMMEQLDIVEKWQMELAQKMKRTGADCEGKELFKICTTSADYLLEHHNKNNVICERTHEIIKDAATCLLLINALGYNKNASEQLQAHMTDMRNKTHPQNQTAFDAAILALVGDINGMIQKRRICLKKWNNLFSKNTATPQNTQTQTSVSK